jgi:hypothetical protein
MARPGHSGGSGGVPQTGTCRAQWGECEWVVRAADLEGDTEGRIDTEHTPDTGLNELTRTPGAGLDTLLRRLWKLGS